MNILQLTNKVPYPPKDGGAIATLNLSKGFHKLGHNVTMLSINTKKHYFEIKDLPRDIKTTVDIKDVYIDTTLKARQAFLNLLFSNKPYNALRFYKKEFTIKLVNLLKDKQFDIIQIEGLYMGMYIPIIREYSDAKISLRAHNIEHEIWQRTVDLQKSGLKKEYLKIITKRIKNLKLNLLNKYDLLVPITERDAIVFNKLGNNKPTHITPTGIDISELKPDNSNIEYPSIFHIGALDWIPNQEGIIWFLDNVLPNLLEKHPTLKFYIAGRNAPQSFINKLNKPNIVFVGEVDNAYDFMNSKAVMIVPLLSGSGMRIKIIEGMALGKTIISSSIGTEGISSTHDKNILIANTPQEFLNEVEKTLINKEFFEGIGENAIKFVKENFDNMSISSSLIDFYTKHYK